jgi:hypothetical protein
MVFSHLLIQSKAIKIRSPSKRGKHRVRSEPLFRVNKEMYECASYYFFSQNSFIIGNGSYGSSSVPNIHGLRAFFRRVPARHVRFIAKLEMTIYLREFNMIFNQPNWNVNNTYLIGSKEDVQTFRSLFGSLERHFPDLRSLQIHCERGDKLRYAYGYNPKPYLVDPSREMAKAILATFKCKQLENVRWKVDPWGIDLKEVDGMLTKLMPEMEELGWNRTLSGDQEKWKAVKGECARIRVTI